MKKTKLIIPLFLLAALLLPGCAAMKSTPERPIKLNGFRLPYSKQVHFPAGPQVPGYGPFND